MACHACLILFLSTWAFKPTILIALPPLPVPPRRLVTWHRYHYLLWRLPSRPIHHTLTSKTCELAKRKKKQEATDASIAVINIIACKACYLTLSSITYLIIIYNMANLPNRSVPDTSYSCHSQNTYFPTHPACQRSSWKSSCVRVQRELNLCVDSERQQTKDSYLGHVRPDKKIKTWFRRQFHKLSENFTKLV